MSVSSRAYTVDPQQLIGDDLARVGGGKPEAKGEEGLWGQTANITSPPVFTPAWRLSQAYKLVFKCLVPEEKCPNNMLLW